MAKLLTSSPHNTYLAVDYTIGLELMIQSGSYDWINRRIKRYFPIKPTTNDTRFEWSLLDSQPDIPTKDAVASIICADPTRPWMAARIEHLLAFGAMNPEEQQKSPIVALGSVKRLLEGRVVPYLGTCELAPRTLDVFWWNWATNLRMLVVRHVSQT